MKFCARALLVLIGTTFGAHAGDWLDQSYITLDVGPAFVQDFDLETRSDVVTSAFVGGFKLGIRGDVTLGHNFSPHWALELETGASWNPGFEASEEIYQIPFLVNARYRVVLNDRWTVDLRAGPGGVYSKMDALVAVGPFMDPQRLDLDGIAFACQAGAGVNFRISPHAELNLDYKFLGSFAHSWHERILVPPPFTGKMTLDADAILTHSVLLSLTLKF